MKVNKCIWPDRKCPPAVDMEFNGTENEIRFLMCIYEYMLKFGEAYKDGFFSCDLGDITTTLFGSCSMLNKLQDSCVQFMVGAIAHNPAVFRVDSDKDAEYIIVHKEGNFDNAITTRDQILRSKVKDVEIFRNALRMLPNYVILNLSGSLMKGLYDELMRAHLYLGEYYIESSDRCVTIFDRKFKQGLEEVFRIFKSHNLHKKLISDRRRQFKKRLKTFDHSLSDEGDFHRLDKILEAIDIMENLKHASDGDDIKPGPRVNLDESEYCFKKDRVKEYVHKSIQQGGAQRPLAVSGSKKFPGRKRHFHSFGSNKTLKVRLAENYPTCRYERMFGQCVDMLRTGNLEYYTGNRTIIRLVNIEENWIRWPSGMLRNITRLSYVKLVTDYDSKIEVETYYDDKLVFAARLGQFLRANKLHIPGLIVEIIPLSKEGVFQLRSICKATEFQDVAYWTIKGVPVSKTARSFRCRYEVKETVFRSEMQYKNIVPIHCGVLTAVYELMEDKCGEILSEDRIFELISKRRSVSYSSVVWTLYAYDCFVKIGARKWILITKSSKIDEGTKKGQRKSSVELKKRFGFLGRIFRVITKSLKKILSYFRLSMMNNGL